MTRKKKLFIVLGVLFLVAAVAQIIVITVTVGGKSVVINHQPNSTITYTLASAAADVNGNFSLDVSQTTSRRPASAFQFDITYDPTVVTGLNVVPGSVANNAGKSVTCSDFSSTVKRCLVVGLSNNTGVANGTIATITGNAKTNTNLSLSNLSASSGDGTGLAVVLTPTGGAVTVSVAVSTFICAPPSYELPGLPPGQYNLEQGETIGCTVTLNQPAGPGGFTAPIAASPSGVTVPSSITIAQGATTGTFSIVGQ